MLEEESVFISLKEATQFCNYSQEYLSLRARQGKLKAIKFGKNWVIKKEWLEEYLQKIEEYSRNLDNKKTFKETFPPENLPTEPERLISPVSVGIVFLVVLALSLTTAIIFYSKETFQNVYRNTTPLVVEFNENFNKGASGLSHNFAKEASSYVWAVGGAGDVAVENAIDFLVDAVSLTAASVENAF